MDEYSVNADLGNVLVASWWSAYESVYRRSLTAAIENVLNTQDFEVIRAVDATSHEQAIEQRLTHDTLRRISRTALVAIAVTQLAYFSTGVVILNPVAAVILTLVGMSFHRMSTLMRREIEQVLRAAPPSLRSV
jgi:hypothetical protein